MPLPPELSALLDAGDEIARETAWKQFVETHSPLLLHAARAVGRSYDATMDAYAYLLEQLRRDDFHRLRAYVADERSGFTAWLLVVARRLCVDHLRQRYGRRDAPSPRSREAGAVRRQLVDLLAEELDVTSLTDPSGHDPETEMRSRELGTALTNALAGLDPLDQLLLKLRFEDGLSVREVGRVMSFSSPFQVYRRLNAILKRLQDALRQRGYQGPEP